MTLRRWKMIAPDRLVWKCWNEHPTDPLTLIYHRDSDDTHLLNAFGATILKLLEKQPLTQKELLAALAIPFPDAAIPEYDVEHFLATMTQAGILEVIE
ncbi:MAG: HPr-rel-A system PqqD family peptide chaperone [Planctomycetia bacterium]|nr:HPr-rel-A system PqqD family peptide chaperone [Planctomycetia bacterium]